jgi:sugar lactone lactonase YvrE
MKLRRITPAVIALWTATACSSIAVSPSVVRSAASNNSNATGSTLYAFSPDKPLVAAYANGGSGDVRPISLLEGSETQLSTGNGMAVDSDGTLYVVVYDSASSTSPLKLLVFAPGARGNAMPERTAVLNGGLLAGYASGLALDGHGNFWISDIGKLLRFPTSAKGNANPNASITLQLDTPDGFMAAHSANVAVDSTGNVYCACTVVFQQEQAIGISEYSLRRGKKAKLVRSFYDFNLPEVPPSSIAVDPSGVMYLASSLPNSGVFAYDATTKSGHVIYNRRFTSGSGTIISSLATDASGSVYVAAESRVMVFGPNANGHVRPIRSIVDKKHLHYGTGDYGSLLSVR